jgi:hypothetical protein
LHTNLTGLSYMTEFDERLSRVLEQSIYGDFILGIIHNLSTPLSGILGGAQLLEMRMKAWTELLKNLPIDDSDALQKIFKDHEKNIGNVELIIRNARNLSDLISNMVQTQNKSVLEDVEVINLQEFLRQVLKFLEGDMVFKHQVKKNIDIPEGIPPLRFVYNHVSQLLIEWIRRCLPALEHHEVPKLDISVTREDKKTTLKLTLNVVLEENEPLRDMPGGLIPFVKGLRLPFSFYIDRINALGQSAELTKHDHETTLTVTFSS